MGSGCATKKRPDDDARPLALEPGTREPPTGSAPMVILECQCGFAAGTEVAFRKHLDRFPGMLGHGLRVEASNAEGFEEHGDRGDLPLTSTTGSSGSRLPGQPRAIRAMSQLSQAAMADLTRSGVQLADIEAQVEEINFQLNCRAILPAQAKTDLAQLETKAKQLETTGVDAVYTSELNSGKVEAKTQKKDQLARLEALFDRFEELFKQIRAEEAVSR